MRQGSVTELDNLLLSLNEDDGETAKAASASPSSTATMEQAEMRGVRSSSEPPKMPRPASLVSSSSDAARRIAEEVAATKGGPVPARPKQRAPLKLNKDRREFVPYAPSSLEEAGLTMTEVSHLVIKYLASRGLETGYNISLHCGLKFPIVEQILRQLKIDRLAAYKNSIAGGDFLYELTDLGHERARTLVQQSTYFGTAPVPLDQYTASVRAQTLEGRKPTLAAIRRAFGDLDINDQMLSNIGQAIHSGRGMFLYGEPGNGKTSMAERVTKSFGDTIWIPRSIVASDEIIRLFDPNRHREVPVTKEMEQEVDGRWVQVERPTIVAGGELTMDNLEITYIRSTGIGEAPLQLKANCGTLLIDDFGRQRMSTDELLNRWIVPLEERHDFLHLESGRTIQVPFDQLIIFSSNLEPRDLVDDAFLRRIPYKIEVKDASEAEFRNLFIKMSNKAKMECSPEVVEYLIQEHYISAQRPFRFCHPRDLLRQIENRCSLHNLPREVTKEAVDQAIENYFSIM